MTLGPISGEPESGPGSGDVDGPASSTDGNVALFNGATGKVIKDSGFQYGTFSTILLKNGSNTIVNAQNTDPDVYSGDLVQIQLTANGGSTLTGSADAYRLIRGDITLTTGTQSGVFTTVHFQANTSGSAIISGTGGNGLRGLIASAVHNSTGTAASIVGLNSNAAVGASGSAATIGTVTAAYGNRITTGYVSGFVGSGVITSDYGLWVSSPQATSVTATIATYYGVFVEDAVQTGVTTAYSIFTGTGRVRLGGNVEFSTGTAIDATLYTFGRDNDGTNQLHANVPTGAGYELSVNDVAEYVLTATDFDMKGNTLSNIGGNGTDFAAGGSLIIGPNATATGSIALAVNQANHTAITANMPALSTGNYTHTLNSGSTITTLCAVSFAAPTYNGVAGGGTESATDAATVRILGPAVQGSNITITNLYSLLVESGSSKFGGRVLMPQSADVASGGTITMGNGNFAHITGTTTIDFLTTTGWTNGSVVFLKFDGSVTVNHNTGGAPAGTSNFQLSGAANFGATANDTLTLMLDGPSWREIARTVI